MLNSWHSFTIHILLEIILLVFADGPHFVGCFRKWSQSSGSSIRQSVTSSQSLEPALEPALDVAGDLGVSVNLFGDALLPGPVI